MLPFVLLATRAEDVAADAEYAAMLRYGGLEPAQLLRVRLEAGPMPAIDLDAISGLIVGDLRRADIPDALQPERHAVHPEPAVERISTRIRGTATPLLRAGRGQTTRSPGWRASTSMARTGASRSSLAVSVGGTDLGARCARRCSLARILLRPGGRVSAGRIRRSFRRDPFAKLF